MIERKATWFLLLCLPMFLGCKPSRAPKLLCSERGNIVVYLTLAESGCRKLGMNKKYVASLTLKGAAGSGYILGKQTFRIPRGKSKTTIRWNMRPYLTRPIFHRMGRIEIPITPIFSNGKKGAVWPMPVLFYYRRKTKTWPRTPPKVRWRSQARKRRKRRRRSRLSLRAEFVRLVRSKRGFPRVIVRAEGPNLWLSQVFGRRPWLDTKTLGTFRLPLPPLLAKSYIGSRFRTNMPLVYQTVKYSKRYIVNFENSQMIGAAVDWIAKGYLKPDELWKSRRRRRRNLALVVWKRSRLSRAKRRFKTETFPFSRRVRMRRVKAIALVTGKPGRTKKCGPYLELIRAGRKRYRLRSFVKFRLMDAHFKVMDSSGKVRATKTFKLRRIRCPRRKPKQHINPKKRKPLLATMSRFDRRRWQTWLSRQMRKW